MEFGTVRGEGGTRTSIRSGRRLSPSLRGEEEPHCKIGREHIYMSTSKNAGPSYTATWSTWKRMNTQYSPDLVSRMIFEKLMRKAGI